MNKLFINIIRPNDIKDVQQIAKKYHSPNSSKYRTINKGKTSKYSKYKNDDDKPYPPINIAKASIEVDKLLKIVSDGLIYYSPTKQEVNNQGPANQGPANQEVNNQEVNNQEVNNQEVNNQEPANQELNNQEPAKQVEQPN
jgi:hypothetical protein